MTEAILQAILTHNQAALAELQRAISLRPHRFSLVLAQCNYTRLQSLFITSLSESLGSVTESTGSPRAVRASVRAVELSPRSRNLRAALVQGLEAEPQLSHPVLMVTGLESVAALTPLLQAANLGRDAFPVTVPCPVVLWLNEHSLSRLTRHAPDFKSFAAAPLVFRYPTPVLIQSLHQNADQLFATMLSLGDDSPHPSHTRRYQPGSLLRTELDFALADLAATHTTLDTELQASLAFLQGRDALGRGDLKAAHRYFDQSLTYWQNQTDLLDAADATPPGDQATQGDPQRAIALHHQAPTPRQKQAVLLFYLGATWRSRAARERLIYRQLLVEAENRFSQCLALFRAEGRLDWVGKFLHALAEVKQKQEDWAGLGAIAQEGLRLHRGDAVRLARNYGYLAEVSLAQNEIDQAQSQAEKALYILKVARAVAGQTRIYPADLALAEKFQRGWYRYLLAQVRIRQGQAPAALVLLEQARQETHPRLDLLLYRRILDTLRQQYYAQQDYRAAFQVKQHQRQVDTQFKLRAFMGAGAIQPYGLGSAQRVSPQQAAEIEASGRGQDVAALVARLTQPRYPLITLHGPSGVGKSSLLYGGLVPALWGAFPEGRATLPVIVKSYRQWLSAVDQALALSQRQQGIPPAVPLDLTATALVRHIQAVIEQRFVQVVLIFDQVEEFLVEVPDLPERQGFYQFLVDCLNTPYLKIVLALREDYLHYLLELERGFDLDILNQDILSRDYRYYLGNFRWQDAHTLIQRLTREANLDLEPALVDQLVADLAVADQVRPIELQVVGAQLQDEDITTLAAYERLGDFPKETLVQRFLDGTVKDCGLENVPLAQGVLYLLTDIDREQRPYRPPRSRDDLAVELTLRGSLFTQGQLDLVLEVLVGSGLVFTIPDPPLERYQLVHDYLVDYVRREDLPAHLGWRG